MAASNPPFALQSLLEKMSSPDSDYRFMSLNDLLSILTSPNGSLAQADTALAGRVIDGVVKSLDDANGEVQNLAVKCLGPLVLKIRDAQIAPLIDRLTTLSMSSSDPSIPSTALRTIISSLPRPATNSTLQTGTGSAQKQDPVQQTIVASVHAVQKTLLPKLLILLKPGNEVVKAGGATLDSIDLLIETLRCFGPILTGAEVERLQVAVMNLLESDRTTGVVKKRAVIALSLLCLYSPDELLSSFINHLIESFRAQDKHRNPTRLRLLVSVTGALARGIPARFGPYLKILCPFILSVVDGRDIQDRELGDEPEMEMDEVREAALVSLESFQSFCTSEMIRFTDDVLNAGMIYLKYDPNYADPGDEEGDEEMGGTQQEGEDDEDDEFGGSDDEGAFEDDGDFSDEDDISWKVRRCAAKLLSTVISTRAADLIKGKGEGGGKAYTDVAPLLVKRFHEREENVRLEVLATATVLVRKTGEVAEGTFVPSVTANVPGDMAMGPPPKIRRGSDASMLDGASQLQVPVPSADEAGVKESLQALIPELSKSLSKLFKAKTTTLPTKQASITLLSSIVSILHGGLDGVLGLFIEPLVEAVRGGSTLSSTGNVVAATAGAGSAATATGSSLRVEVLKLVGKICENHSAAVVGEFFDSLIPAIIVAVKESAYKISSEALGTIVAIVKLLTTQGAQSYALYLQGLYDVVLEKVQSSESDLEVREKAIVALGVVLARTSGEVELIGQDRRTRALDLLVERLRNETTRVTAVRAIEGIARSTKTAEDVNDEWVKIVVVECGAQLRKSNRSLRGASLDALKSIAANEICRRKLDSTSKKELIDVLTPLLVVGDMHLLAPALAIIKLMMLDGGVFVSQGIIDGISGLAKSSLGSGLVVENLLLLIKTIGEVDDEGKKRVMNSLLRDVGVNGDTGVVARLVAQLHVSGGGKEGGFAVGVGDFVGEVESSSDDKRKCLGLMVLGEIGLRMGASFPVGPEIFLNQFHAKSDDVPIAAAVALGLAAAGNVSGYLPVIMQRLGGGDKDQYLLLHSLKEIIQHSNDTTADIKPYADQIWNALFAIAKNDDSKAVGAECVGRLTIIDPYSFLPELQKHLQSPFPAIRGMVISALRYTFTDTEASYDDLLRPIVVEFLTVMVDDKEMENRRLALTALNSAAHNKPHLIMPHLERLLPLVYRESFIKPELVREVMMGPFKHKVDDGLEVRKSAYETLYALLETSFSGIDVRTYFDRVIVGLQDEHDIRALCNLMLTKLIHLAREETLSRLDSISDCFRTTLSTKPKENAVKQEIEKHHESIRSTMRATLTLNGEFGGSGGQKKWAAYWEWAKTAFMDELQALEAEDRDL